MDLNKFFDSLTDDQKKNLSDALLSSVDKKKETKPTKSKTKAIKVSATRKKLPQKQEQVIDENFTVIKAESKDSQSRRKEPVKARKNTWKDTGDHKDVHTPEYERTPRRREPHKNTDVECHVCGRSFKADPRFIFGEFYRCNKCVGK